MTTSNTPRNTPQGAPAPDANQWHLGYLPPAISLYAMAAAVGLVTGLMASFLKLLIRWTTLFVSSHIHISGSNPLFLAVPVTGILLTVAFQRWVVRSNLEHSVTKVEGYLRRGDYRLPDFYTWAPLVASSLTLGFGGSAGGEGPIATSGGAIGSMFARKCGLPPRLMLVLIACGAGAGIAGIFKAPVGGILFTIEVVGVELATVPLLAVIIACLIGGMTSYAITGFTLDVPLVNVQHFHLEMTGWVILAGIFCGLYSVYYRWAGLHVRALYRRIGSPWLNGLCSGAMLSVIVFLLPALYGEGYDTMARVIDGDLAVLSDFSFFSRNGAALPSWGLVLVSGCLALAKPVACMATNSGGGVAGDFAPTLFAGCMAGLFFAGLMSLFPGVAVYSPNLALCGMAAVMAGVIKAPLMAIFIVIEMTGYVGMMFPVMLAAGFSYGTMLLVGHLYRQYWRNKNIKRKSSAPEP